MLGIWEYFWTEADWVPGGGGTPAESDAMTGLSGQSAGGVRGGDNPLPIPGYRRVWTWMRSMRSTRSSSGPLSSPDSSLSGSRLH